MNVLQLLMTRISQAVSASSGENGSLHYCAKKSPCSGTQHNLLYESHRNVKNQWTTYAATIMKVLQLSLNLFQKN